jgi:hypothetical protein
MELKEKAWVFNKSRFEESYFVPDDVFYAETFTKAKSIALNSIKYDDYKTFLGEEITYLNIPLVRNRQYDRYLINGEIKTLDRIEIDRKYKERADRLVALVEANPDAKAYIRKGGYYYKPNSCGYTERLEDAGVYSIQEAVESVKRCSIGDNMDAIVIDVEAHNLMILNKIKELKQKLI